MTFFYVLSALFSATVTLANPLELDDVLEISRTHADQMSIISEEEKAAVAEIDSYKSGALPQLNSEISVMRNSIPTATILSQPGVGDPDNPQLSNLPDRFYTTQYGLNVSLTSPLFTFGRLGSVWTIANKMEEQSAVGRRLKESQHFLKTIQLYTDALLAVNLEKVAATNTRLTQNLLDFTELEYRSGARSKVDYLRIKSNYELAKADYLQKKLAARAKQYRLKNYLGYKQDNFAIKAGTKENLHLFKQTNSQAGKERLDLTMQKLAADIALETHDYRKADYYPSLSLAGGIRSSLTGKTFYNEGFEPEDALDRNYHTYSIGLVLTWNLFDGFRTNSEVKKAAAEKKIAAIKAEQLAKDTIISREEATEQYSIADLLFDANKKAVEAARMAMEMAESDYKAGSMSLTELLEIQKQLLETETQKFSSYSQKILAAANLRFELGLNIYERNGQ